MNVILEGPDGAGKSTLAAYLSQRLGIEVRHSGGPSKYAGEVNVRALEYIYEEKSYIYDRHPCFSQNIYNAAFRRENHDWVPVETIKALEATKPLIIYCRASRPLTDHAISDHADLDHHNAVEANYQRLCEYYDAWAQGYAHLFYRIGDDIPRFLDAVAGACGLEPRPSLKQTAWDPMRDVEEFHHKFGQAYEGPPRLLPPELAEFREGFIDEEFQEYRKAVHFARLELEQPSFDSHFDDRNFREYLEGALDSLVDLVYVALGTSQFHGFDFRRAWDRVHKANMAKVRATKNMRTKRGNSTYDIMKPPGWKPPSHADLVRNHAHLQKSVIDPAAGIMQIETA